MSGLFRCREGVLVADSSKGSLYYPKLCIYSCTFICLVAKYYVLGSYFLRIAFAKVLNELQIQFRGSFSSQDRLQIHFQLIKLLPLRHPISKSLSCCTVIYSCTFVVIRINN